MLRFHNVSLWTDMPLSWHCQLPVVLDYFSCRLDGCVIFGNTHWHYSKGSCSTTDKSLGIVRTQLWRNQVPFPHWLALKFLRSISSFVIDFQLEIVPSVSNFKFCGSFFFHEKLMTCEEIVEPHYQSNSVDHPDVWGTWRFRVVLLSLPSELGIFDESLFCLVQWLFCRVFMVCVKPCSSSSAELRGQEISL